MIRFSFSLLLLILEHVDSILMLYVVKKGYIIFLMIICFVIKMNLTNVKINM